MRLNILVGFIAGTAMLAAPAMAASNVILRNGGLGQQAENHDHFGVAICNDGVAAANSLIPFEVTANNKTIDSAISGPFAAGTCIYRYLTYADFNMLPNRTYTVSVTIDPNHTTAADIGPAATYSMSVPADAQVSMNFSPSVGRTWYDELALSLTSGWSFVQALIGGMFGK